MTSDMDVPETQLALKPKHERDDLPAVVEIEEQTKRLVLSLRLEDKFGAEIAALVQKAVFACVKLHEAHFFSGVDFVLRLEPSLMRREGLLVAGENTEIFPR